MKKLLIFLILISCLLCLASCGKSAADTPPVSGADDGKTAPEVSAKDGTTAGNGDENDMAEESIPENDAPTDEAVMIYDRIPMVMVDGVLYLDMGRKSTVTARCGVMDGTIDSQVPGSEIPAEDDQSNFGTGYGYQYGPEEGTIELCIDGEWYVYATEEKRQTMQFGPTVTDIVDRTETEDIATDTAMEEFWRDGDQVYYFPTIKSDFVEVKLSDGTVMSVNEALERGYITVGSLDDFGIGYYVQQEKPVP